MNVSTGRAPMNVAHVRDLRGVVDREKAEMGVLLCMVEPTAPMRKEAASTGFYTSPWGRHSRLQILTIEDLLTGKAISRPPTQASVTFKRAPKAPMQVRERQAGIFNSGTADEQEPF